MIASYDPAYDTSSGTNYLCDDSYYLNIERADEKHHSYPKKQVFNTINK